MARASAECLAAARSGLRAPDAYINLDHGRSTDSREFLQASSIRRQPSIKAFLPRTRHAWRAISASHSMARATTGRFSWLMSWKTNGTSIYMTGLYFARSWTGELWLRAKIDFSALDARIPWVEAKLDGDYADPIFVISVVYFLLKSHLYRRELPHPVPEEYSDNPETIANFSMNAFGRWASFASLGDTTGVLFLGQ